MLSDAMAGVDDLRAKVDAGLVALAPSELQIALYDAVRFVLEGTGKRIRALLVLTTGRALGATVDAAMPGALAVEVFHNFTLVHDDIMDRAESRRGRPSVHVKWDESIGILAGDYLLGLSFDLLNRLEGHTSRRAIAAFHEMVARLCEGQALDTEFESRPIVNIEEYLDMIGRKTGALIETSLVLGGLVADVDDETVRQLRAVGRNAGLAFQIQDDLLDLTAESQKWGKPVGGDLIIGKKSFLTVRALEIETNSGGEPWFSDHIASGGVPKDSIAEARNRLDTMGVLAEATNEIERHYSVARDALRPLERSNDLSEVNYILERLLARSV
jgi:geranylgeranyl diphosphate synthase type II